GAAARGTPRDLRPSAWGVGSVRRREAQWRDDACGARSCWIAARARSDWDGEGDGLCHLGNPAGHRLLAGGWPLPGGGLHLPGSAALPAVVVIPSRPRGTPRG